VKRLLTVLGKFKVFWRYVLNLGIWHITTLLWIQLLKTGY